MTPAAERRTQIDHQAAKLARIVRGRVVEVTEGCLATLERIRVQDYPPAAADHLIEVLRELNAEVDDKLRAAAVTIGRLRNGLENVERRLISMSKAAAR